MLVRTPTWPLGEARLGIAKLSAVLVGQGARTSGPVRWG